jgi:hypothetical protein
MSIVEVNGEQASHIIETREPIGLFYHQEGEWFVGIDNSTGDAWTEDFISLDLCIKWLKREVSMDDLEFKGE